MGHGREGRGRAAALVAVLLAAGGCAATLPRPRPDDAAWAAERWTGTSVEDLAADRVLVVRKCSGCHTLHPATRLREDQWQNTVAVMAKEHKLGISDVERSRIVRFLRTFAREGRAPDQPAP